MISKAKLKYISEGRCAECREPNDRTTAQVCSSCSKAHAPYMKARRELLKENGNCVSCCKPNKSRPGFSYCQTCKEANTKRAAASNKRIVEERRKTFLSLKHGKGCLKCGESHPACLDYHHLDPTTKKFQIGMGWRSRPWEDVLSEIAKCELLCSNCHRKLHWKH